MRIPNSKCEICGKEKYRRPSELKKAKHICCKECRSVLYKKYPEIVKNLDKGWGWNKGMSKVNGDELSYGKPRSNETKKRISQVLQGKVRVERIEKGCKECGKNFKGLPSQIKRQIFCSHDCAMRHIARNCIHLLGADNPNWKGGTPIMICAICGGKFQSRKATAKYCSLKCKHEGHSRFMVDTPPMVKTYDTDIEQMVETWLKENGIKYEKQKPIESISTPDFFIEPNICLYADGDYWHNKLEVIKRDERINKQLMSKGYKVIRLLGSQIKQGVNLSESIFR